ncbi:MAG: DUF3466 family protein [Phycisphaerales bacterium]|nr:DUF3466 family protein [Phycisphaerales bacterium]
MSLTAIVSAVGCIHSAAAQDYRYALFQLPAVDGIGGAAASLTQTGRLAGVSDFESGTYYHATMWEANGDFADLGSFRGHLSSAQDINELGEVVGWGGESVFGDQHAFLWRDGQMIDLGTLGGEESVAHAINDLSQVAGYSDYEGGSGGGFFWENGKMATLPTLGRSGGTAYDINNASQLVGRSVDPDGNGKAVLWENGDVIALPTLRSDPSTAIAINELGQIVGQSDGPNDNAHAVAWVDGQIVDLHNSELGIGSSAWGINNLGQVVGWVGRQPTNVYGFLWDQTNGMRRLDDLVPPKPRRNWRISMARDVNDAGQIAAEGYVAGQPLTLYPFLINPVNPTMELSSPVPGAAPGPNTLTLTGATPGAEVVFLYALHSGGTRIPGCDLQQNALQLDQPTVIGSAIADQDGVASITRPVPLIARGQTILFQAVVQNECTISQLVVHEFE